MNMCRIVLALGVVAAGLASSGAEMSKREWQAKVAVAAKNPATARSAISKIAKADQCAFLKAVNAAVAKLPESNAKKAERFVAVNKAAIQGAAAENRVAVLAETFATVPPAYLPGVESNFSETLFSRKADDAVLITDAQFSEIASRAVAAVADRCESVDNADVRTTFAILLFTRSSGGAPADLPETLVDKFVSEGARDAAKTQWIPAAMAAGAARSYGALLGDNATAATETQDAAKDKSEKKDDNASDEKNEKGVAVKNEKEADGHGVSVPVATQQLRDSLLADFSASASDSSPAGGVSASAYASPSENRAADGGEAQAQAQAQEQPQSTKPYAGQIP